MTKTVYSALQPSGSLTIGNYLGSIRNFKNLQDEYECFFNVADLHSITVPQEPKSIRERSFDLIAIFLASGLDPEKSTLFVQSHVPQHAELSWVLNCMSYMGQLNRMTQFKEKSQKSEENLNAGLFTYPVLMAADILLYQTDLVPVGIDQKQHLELARDLAIRFNNKYSETFKVPEGIIGKETGKIMSLKNPEKKMSKSDEDQNSFILLLDDEETIKRKIRKSVTDSLGNFDYNDEQKGLKNLINMYIAFSGLTSDEIVNKYKNENYSVFKEDLGQLIADNMKDIREKHSQFIKDKAYLEKVMREGAEKASYIANKTLRKVYKKVGFLPR
ncbi:MAG: tryptophan--tRNA ligase [Peptoniphilaceae bacterium]|uniref:tryptophan--tRNA ligase n=1 Tax=Parvimonas sp. TaxID=1944660 RepID=UPI0025E9F9C8|nr:tryptophan--tRNA ligase [Parvimonas sp.]MCI5997554.1 tryptophan--tRNA ligase [Parvimonas sp.]MDD7765149.1 tryptophan--tRNA ligase [Peptoniphilaceae bacterium]MDY3051234.1 tryptophan--tRNA ligase [Parvimonas sp.]